MILVLGEALLDVFAGADTATGLLFDARVGGSPFNVAVGLARLARPVAFAGGVSTDRFGERLLQALRAEGVDVSLVQRPVAPTTLSVISADAAGVPTYAFHGDQGADRQLCAAPLEHLPAAIRAVHVGSYPLVVEPIASSLRRVVEASRAQRLIACDPNVRLNVEPSVLRWRAAVEWMVQRTHLLKISAEDAGLLYPDVPLDALARRWLAQGVALVVATCGGDGALAWTARAQGSARAQEVTLVDTVGAGDTFQAALLAWLGENERLQPQALAALSGEELGSALRFAARAAAITCGRRGADLPRRAEL
ncbi:carbohydrate kinase family protein [Ramlibacter sp. AN1133]|uniref:carbohydrate kinase family protein n=1 Tax=Ramlibacter sp. AN1133 TaxID=3133429 RepID=UPI0030BC67C4